MASNQMRGMQIYDDVGSSRQRMAYGDRWKPNVLRNTVLPLAWFDIFMSRDLLANLIVRPSYLSPHSIGRLSRKKGDKRPDSDDHLCGSEIVLVNLACMFLSGSACSERLIVLHDQLICKSFHCACSFKRSCAFLVVTIGTSKSKLRTYSTSVSLSNKPLLCFNLRNSHPITWGLSGKRLS
jgi:hypothetical protein